MKKLIYYPGFEVYDPTWLKFALLYIDELDPIIPFSADELLTELHHKLSEETDLIRAHRPDYSQGARATRDAVLFVEQILRHPRLFRDMFASENVVACWREKDRQRYTLFEDKYVPEWTHFCVKEKLGHEVEYGLHLPKELGFIYMTILAQAVADDRGMETITDRQPVDQLSISIRKPPKGARNTIQIARREVEAVLPTNLRDVPLDTLIKLREKPDFKKKMRAFQEKLEAYIVAKEAEKVTGDFTAYLGTFWKDYSDEMAKIGIILATTSISFWSAVAAPVATPVATWAAALAAGGLAVNTVVAIRASFEDKESKRFARKYLADISKIMPVAERDAVIDPVPLLRSSF